MSFDNPHAALVAEATFSSLKALRLAVADLENGLPLAWKRVAEEAATLGQCLGKLASFIDELPAAQRGDTDTNRADPNALGAAVQMLDRMKRLKDGHRCPACGGVC